MKQCIPNLLLSKYIYIYFFVSTILLIIHCSDLGAYQQPARESLSTFQDVTVAGVGKKIVFFYFLCVFLLSVEISSANYI
jgi:hypothetical protein